jgi:hypothetical protein
VGLRATGSIDYTIEDVYVPAAFTYYGPETPVRGGPLFTLGITHIALYGHSAWTLWVSRRMLDELCALVRWKAGRPGTMAAHQGFQAIYGEAEARGHAARCFVYETWPGASETISSGATLSVEQKTLLRLAVYNATWAAEAISVAVYRAGGTTALRSGVMQRYFWDVHAGTQHVTSAPGVIEACGRHLGGLAPAHDWLHMDLVSKAS